MSAIGDGFVRLELFDEDIRLGGVVAAEDRPGPLVDEADLVFSLALMSEVSAVAIVDQCKDTAADRDAGLAGYGRPLSRPRGRRGSGRLAARERLPRSRRS